MSETELTPGEKRIYNLAKSLDDAQPYAYRIHKGGTGRYHIYRTKLYKYKAREAKIIGTFKTLADCHAALSKIEKRIKYAKEQLI